MRCVAGVWALCRKTGEVVRIDTKTYKPAKTLSLGIENVTGTLAAGSGSIWASLVNFPVIRVDPTIEKERIAQEFWGDGGGAVYFAANALWVTGRQGKVQRIDPKRVIATLPE